MSKAVPAVQRRKFFSTIPCVRDRKFLAIPSELTYNFKAVPPVGDLPMGGDGINAVPHVTRKDG